MSQGEDGGTVGGGTTAGTTTGGGGSGGGGGIATSSVVAPAGSVASNNAHLSTTNGHAAATTTTTTATNNISNGRRSRGGSASTHLHHAAANGHHHDGHGANGTGSGGAGGAGLMSLIRERQRAAGSTQILDLSYANLETFPTEIEFLRDVLEKLTMSHNSIRTLPLQLNMFTSLRYLNIRANSIRIFPAVLCHLLSLEILDMSRNKISRFPDSFGNLMNLRVLSISKNRLETIPTYIGEMSQLQFLKIEQNPIVFPPPEIVDFPGEDMEGWLNSLKSFLVAHKKEHGVMPTRIRGDEHSATHQELTPLSQQRAVRSASADSLVIPQTHRQSRSEPGLRLSIPAVVERSGSHSGTLSPEPTTSKLVRTNSQHGNGNHGNHGDDHYRFISHSRGISGDSTSSFGSTTSNDCDKYSDMYFQRLATHPPPPHPLPGERVRLVEAARGILFALSQIYRAVKQVVGCSTDEKFSLLFTRLLQSANSAMTQLIQALDRFDNSAQVQVPDQSICSEIMRCCESNVVAFRKLVHVVQTQIRSISMVADARLVRNLVLLLHGALSEIRMAWDSLLPLLQGSGELSVEVVESNHPMLKDQQSNAHHHQQQQIQQAMMFSGTNYQQQQAQQHHIQLQHHPQLQHQLSSNNLTLSHQPHPFQLSPTMPTPSNWLPVQIPQRSQNMSRASNHSAQSNNIHHDDEEDTQLLMIVEHAIEAARRLIQSLSETCMTRVENLMASPQHRVSPRARSVSASPPRSTGSGSSASSNLGSAGGKQSTLDQQDGSTATLSPPQLSNEQSSSSSSVNGESAKPSVHKAKSETENLIRSPLFSPVSDTVPYSNGMCLSLPINLSTSTTTTTSTTTETTAAGSAVSTTHASEDNGSTRQERRAGTHSKGSSKASFDPALPSIPQDEAHEVSQTPAITTPPYQPVMTARSASVSGLPSISQQALSSHYSSAVVASSLPTQGFLSQGSVQSHHYGSQASGLGVAQLPASQLWREMKECLLQMTEIVKRLDLDLTMIRTEDAHHHSHPSHYQHGQFTPHHQQQYQQNHTPHPHQALGSNALQSQHAQQHGTGTSLDDANILRRRFGMGVSDFVKSVVVISTLVRQLSSTASVNAGRSGSGSSVAGDGGNSSGNSRTTTMTTVTTTTTSSTTILSTSPSAPRNGSVLTGDNSNLTTPTTTGATLYSSVSHTNDMTTTTPSSKAVTPQSGSSSIPGSSSATNLGAMSMMTGSPEKMSSSMHQPSRFLTGNSTTSTTQHQQQQQQQQQHNNGGQTEIFSRLVMTNVSNLTKITKELTVRMPRSSFRDYLLSQQAFGSSSSTSASMAGGGMGGGATGSHFGMITSAGGGGVPNGGVGGGSAAYGGASGGYGYSFGYGPAAASILAMRKGSLI
ncbi:MAG: RAM signaling pathway protein-domain-containing protein [Linnemannia elongata]|nr:MAG: RAM signaling pathway protein-domain-containing protein [Linnemannia elongata]